MVVVETHLLATPEVGLANGLRNARLGGEFDELEGSGEREAVALGNDDWVLGFVSGAESGAPDSARVAHQLHHVSTLLKLVLAQRLHALLRKPVDSKHRFPYTNGWQIKEHADM